MLKRLKVDPYGNTRDEKHYDRFEKLVVAQLHTEEVCRPDLVPATD